jgi:hypothetical protein
MRSRTGKKLGHRREISKEMIKLNLLNDLYPIPSRQSSQHKQRKCRQTATKIRSILDFLEYAHSEGILLELFQ